MEAETIHSGAAFLASEKRSLQPAIPRRHLPGICLLLALAVHLTVLAWPDLMPVSFFEASVAGTVEPADAIVFLGGDTRFREQQSLRLLRDGMGNFLLITGENGFTVRRLQALLPPHQRVVEPSATSTWENAQFSRPLLRARGARSAILVTDWWHSRRALACFRRACPDIRLAVVPACLPDSADTPAGLRRREYLARLWYALRYGIW